ncbi:MAG: hypothetical protein ACK4N5_15640, partial [Myxococcales bacterium]
SALLRGPDGEERSRRSVLYFAERVRGTAAEGSFGQLSPGESVTVGGARALYGFILDELPQENSGSLKIVIADLGSQAEARLLVDPAVNVLRPDQLKVPRIEGLDPSKSYWLTVSGGADLGAGGGAVRSALFYRRAAPGSKERGQGVVSFDRPARVVDAREVLVLLPDDDRMDNKGALWVRLEPAAE